MTPDGPVPIEELKKGNLVLARSEFDPDGPVVARPVLHLFRNRSQIYEVCLDGQVISTTARHPFYVVGSGWQGTNQLKPSDNLLGLDGAVTPVLSTHATGRWEAVFNFEVADDHTFFIDHPAGNTSSCRSGSCLTSLLEEKAS